MDLKRSWHCGRLTMGGATIFLPAAMGNNWLWYHTGGINCSRGLIIACRHTGGEVNSITAIDAHEHQRFNELHCWLVTFVGRHRTYWKRLSFVASRMARTGVLSFYSFVSLLHLYQRIMNESWMTRKLRCFALLLFQCIPPMLDHVNQRSWYWYRHDRFLPIQLSFSHGIGERSRCT